VSRKSPLPQSPHHVLVFDEDWEFLLRNYGPDSPSKMGVGPAIRQIVHAKVLQLRAQIVARQDARAGLIGHSPGIPTDEANAR
jgi:hypothetical protein